MQKGTTIAAGVTPPGIAQMQQGTTIATGVTPPGIAQVAARHNNCSGSDPTGGAHAPQSIGRDNMPYCAVKT